VYCTGSDVSTNAEPRSSSDRTSSPQTVFECQQYRISHQQKKHEQPLFHQTYDMENSLTTTTASSVTGVENFSSRYSRQDGGGVPRRPKNISSHPMNVQGCHNMGQSSRQLNPSSNLYGCNSLSKDPSQESCNTWYTLSSNYPSSSLVGEISRDSTYTSLCSEQYSVEPNKISPADPVKKCCWVNDTADHSANNLANSKKDDKWWLGYVFDERRAQGIITYYTFLIHHRLVSHSLANCSLQMLKILFMVM